jgi:amino acid transporter
MLEEIKGAAKTVPRAMMYSIMVNCFLGGGMLLATLYYVGDLETAATSPTGYPFVAIFASGLKSIAGATVMVRITVVMALSNAIGCLASESRMVWSLNETTAYHSHLCFLRYFMITELQTPLTSKSGSNSIVTSNGYNPPSHNKCYAARIH